MSDLNRNDLRQYARLGAQARLAELRQEEAAIRRAFPDLFAKSAAQPAVSSSGGRRRRSRMSAAARRAVSERMKKYWAERRKVKKQK